MLFLLELKHLFPFFFFVNLLTELVPLLWNKLQMLSINSKFKDGNLYSLLGIKLFSIEKDTFIKVVTIH